MAVVAGCDALPKVTVPGPLTCDHWLVSVHLSQLLVTLPTRLAVLVGRKIVWLAPALTTGDEGFATVYMNPGHPEFAHFQPGPALPISYDDLKVIEAHLFLESVLDGRQREPGVREMLRSAEVIDAMVRSSESGRWEEVRALDP